MVTRKLNRHTKKILLVAIIGAALAAVGVGFILNKKFTSDKESTEFKIDSKNKYEIITDREWKTFKADGGSYESTYYQIDLDNKMVVKKEEIFDSGFKNVKEGQMVQSSTENNTIYIKYLDDEFSRRTKEILDDATNRENVEDCSVAVSNAMLDFEQQYYRSKSFCFKISTLGFEGYVDDMDIVDDINVLLEDYDDL